MCKCVVLSLAHAPCSKMDKVPPPNTCVCASPPESPKKEGTVKLGCNISPPTAPLYMQAETIPLIVLLPDQTSTRAISLSPP